VSLPSKPRVLPARTEAKDLAMLWAIRAVVCPKTYFPLRAAEGEWLMQGHSKSGVLSPEGSLVLCLLSDSKTPDFWAFAALLYERRKAVMWGACPSGVQFKGRE
jgi:hypothetical protein